MYANRFLVRKNVDEDKKSIHRKKRGIGSQTRIRRMLTRRKKEDVIK